jgi:hypothetical protein
MRNTRTVGADWQLLYSDKSGSLAIGINPHDASDALIIPVDGALLRTLGKAFLEHAAPRSLPLNG